MLTKSNKRVDFLFELQQLMDKFDCSISADDHWMGYPECGQDVRMTIEFGDWEVGDIDLGGYLGSSCPIHEILEESK